jgi:hypothetical protein
MQGHLPDMGSIRGDVAALAGMRRTSARAGEREAAAWTRDRLAAAGAADARVLDYRGRSTYGWSFAGHAAAGLGALVRGGRAGALLALAALWSLERDASGRTPWRRRPRVGRATGACALARVPARGKPIATIVLVAHLDAARTGLVWHPAVVRAGAARHLRRRSVDPFLAPVAVALGAGAAAGLAPWARLARAVRGAACAVLGAAVVLNVDVARGGTVPGASDNATGVAVLLDLVRALAAAPLDGVEVVAVCPGGEEAGMGGFHAALEELQPALDPARTLVVGLDTLGAGTPIVVAAEGALRTHRYREADLALAEAGAALAGEPPPERWRIGGWTDPLLALHRGLPAVSLLSMGPGYFPGYHHPTDVPSAVDWGSVARCARVAAGTIAAAAERLTARAGGAR